MYALHIFFCRVHPRFTPVLFITTTYLILIYTWSYIFLRLMHHCTVIV